MSLLKLQVIGHLGQNATVNIVNGKNVINASIAHSEKWKDAAGVQKEKTTWVSISYWTDLTGIVPYLTKGQLIYVEGIPEVTTYTSNRGEVVPQLKLKVFDIKLLGGAKDNASATPSDTIPAKHSDIPQSDDAPF